jgi:hypothetical protein
VVRKVSTQAQTRTLFLAQEGLEKMKEFAVLAAQRSGRRAELLRALALVLRPLPRSMRSNNVFTSMHNSFARTGKQF